ncbi:hypothetical protein ACWF9B_04625 [Streptomyces sp. NPDC055089]
MGETVPVAALAYGDAVLAAFELGFVEFGQRRRLPLGQGWNRRFERADPVREFRWAKGGESFAGLYYSTMVGAHVGYESLLERASCGSSQSSYGPSTRQRKPEPPSPGVCAESTSRLPGAPPGTR